MSIRTRLIVVVFLAGVTLAAAIASIVHVVSTTASARIEAARTHARAAAQQLADAYATRDVPASIGAPTPELLDWMRRESRAVVSIVARAEGGYCTRAAIVVQARAKQDPRKVQLAPEHRAVVEEACESGNSDVLQKLRNREVLALSVVPLSDGAGSAWIAIPVGATNAETTTWQIEVAVLALGTLLLIAVSIDALFALRRGASQLDASLGRLQDDLRAEIAEPRAEELAAIAHRVRRMATHLAEARDREQTLEKKVAHEQRLAGLGRVAAGVAHEIRNPLAGLKLRLDLLARGGTSGAAKQDVDACLEEVARLDRVVRSLLVVARREPPEKTDVPLAPVVDARIALASEMAKEKNVRLVRRGDAIARADADAVARLVDNLVRNAIEASPRDAEVSVEIAKDDATIDVVVVDHGPGVPKDRESEMFEPFFTTKAEGTGLGLWLSRSLVESLGGTLAYLREDGATRFRVTLPAASESH